MTQKQPKDQHKVFSAELKQANKLFEKLKFTDIPLIRLIIINNASIMIKKHKDKEELTEKEDYVYALNDSITALISNFRDIELIEIFLEERLKNNKIVRKGITDPEFIRYHMENYFIRIHKIKDQVCIFLNNYFRLNYRQNNSLEYKLCSDSFFKSTTLPLYISYLTDCLVKTKPIRNQIAHSSNLASSDLAMLEAILLQKRISPTMRKTYLLKKESQIYLFSFISEKNRKILYESIVSMFIILNQAHIADFEKHSGLKIAEEIAKMKIKLI